MQINIHKDLPIGRRLNNDELFSIAIRLDFPDLVKFLSVNSQTMKLCKTDRIWDYKLQAEFSEYINSFQEYTQKDKHTQKEKYKLLYKLNILKNKLKLNYNLDILYNGREIHLANREIETIPEELGVLHNLQCLYLNNNNIQIIPEELFQYKHFLNLRILSLNRNKIENIPEKVCRLYNLQRLSLNHNQIREIPEELCQLVNLKYLDLRHNQIDNIPAIRRRNLPDAEILL